MVNVFSTEFLLDLIMQAKPAKSFLLDTFFKNTESFETEKVRCDLWDGKRRVAAYIRPGGQAQAVGKIGYETEDYAPPLLSPMDITTVEQLLRRQPGEVISRSRQTPRDQALFKLAQQLAELDDMITRAEEIQARDLLFTGKMTFKDVDGHDIGDEIDLGRDEDLDFTPTIPWTSLTTAQPFDDADEIRRRVQRLSGLMIDIAVVGADKWRQFSNMTQVKDKLFFNFQPISGDKMVMEMQASGAIYRGEMGGVKYFTYDEFHTQNDSTGQDDVALVPQDKVLYASSQAIASRLYGVVPKIDQNSNGETITKLYSDPRVPDSWTKKNPDARFVRIQSAALMMTHQRNAYAVLN